MGAGKSAKPAAKYEKPAAPSAGRAWESSGSKDSAGLRATASKEEPRPSGSASGSAPRHASAKVMNVAELAPGDDEVERSFKEEMHSARTRPAVVEPSPASGSRRKGPESRSLAPQRLAPDARGSPARHGGQARSGGYDGRASDADREGKSPVQGATLPEPWTRRLANTMILHTVQNSMILATYLLELLTSGYGARSALHIACWEGSVSAVQVVANGSKKAVQDWHQRKGDLTPLHIAAICSHAEVAELLLGYDIDPDINTVHQLRSLHISATSSTDLCEVLVSSRADITARTADQDTPLHFANCFQQLDTIELLLKAGADASAANNFGVVPLHVAVAYAGLERLELREAKATLLLCAYGAKLDARDHHGHTPAAVARMAGAHSSLIDFLESASEDHQATAQDLLNAVDEDAEDFASSSLALKAMQSEKTAGSDGWAPPSPSVARARANSYAGQDMQLTEENSRLSQETKRLQKELDEARANIRHLQGLLDQSRSTMERLKSTRLSVSEAPGAEAFQAVRDDMEKEMGELRQRQEDLGRDRDSWLQERESLLRQLEEAAEKQERAEATVKRITAERNEALERPAVKDISRPSSAVTRQAAEQAATQDAALFAKEEALSQKDAELQAKAQAEQEALEALQAKDAELERLTAELHAMKSQADRSGKDLEERSAELSQKEADVLSRKAEVQRLNGELERQATEKEELWKNLTELRAQHKELREQQSKTSQELGAVQTQLQEREVELEGQLKEKELTIQKLEEDATQLTGQVAELSGVRERAEQAEKMLEPWKKRTEEVHEAFQKEQALRKRYHNQMQDMKGAIRVFARIRPKVSREADQEISVWRRDAFSLECAAKDKKSTAKDYNFDAVFDEHNSQEDVFADCRGLIGSAVDGFNVTVFAYGQTGAGKTHTMYGNEAMPGLVPRAAEELFTVLRRYAHECESKVLCSMFELYRDDLVDLLFTKAKGKAPPVLDIKKDPRGTVKVENAVEIEVTNPDELQKTISTGMDRRHVAATKMNADSSRSHLIFIVTIESVNKKSKQVSTGKLTLCDLAGSERLKKSEVTGEQMKEAQSINKSLTALGDVIEALTKQAKHVPYRNHRLTQLLSDSLGGNAKTLMFVNCSPASGNLDETGAALAYAVRAKNIVNKVEKNSDSQEVARLKKVVQLLSSELEEARKKAGDAPLPKLGDGTAEEESPQAA